MKKRFFVLAFAALAATSCLNKDLAESIYSIPVSDQEEVVVSADFFKEGGCSEKTVRLTSNRSFSLHLNDLDNPVPPGRKIPWASISTEGFVNLNCISQSTEVVINFTRSYELKPHRGVLEIYCEEKKAVEIPVVQQAYEPRLEVTPSTTHATFEEQNITCYIDGNVDWNVSIDPSSTANATIRTRSGSDIDTLTVKLWENEVGQTKQLKLVFSSDYTSDKIVVIDQDANSGDVKYWNVSMSLSEGSQEASRRFPVLKLDDSRMSSFIGQGADFRYTMSYESFEAAGVPVSSSPEIPSEGIVLLPQDRTSFTDVFVIVSGHLDGYKDTYTKCHIRNWQFGKTFIRDTSYGLVFSAPCPEKNTSSYYMTFFKGTTLTARTTMDGEAGVYFVFFDGYSNRKMVLSYDSLDVQTWSTTTKEGKQTAPVSKQSASFTVVEDMDIVLRNDANVTGTASVGLWQYAIFEQARYRF